MPTAVFDTTFLISHRNGSGTENVFRQGYLSASGTGSNAWWCPHAFFDYATMGAFLQNKVVDGLKIRITTSDYGVTSNPTMYIHKGKFKYSPSASRLDPNNAYPGGEYANADGTVISGYVESQAIPKSAVTDVVLPLDFLTHVLAGWGLCGFRRNISTPSGSVLTREATAIALVVDYHDTESIKVNVGGTYRNGVPQANIGGVWRQGIALVNAGGIWRRGIS